MKSLRSKEARQLVQRQLAGWTEPPREQVKCSHCEPKWVCPSICVGEPLLCVRAGMKLSLSLLLHREAQMPNFSDILHQARMGTPAPIALATRSRALALCGAGGLSPFSVSLARAWHCCCFYPLTKARPARPAVSEFLLLGCVCRGGGTLTSFSPSNPRGPCRACLLARGCCYNFWAGTGERRVGDSALGRES